MTWAIWQPWLSTLFVRIGNVDFEWQEEEREAAGEGSFEKKRKGLQFFTGTKLLAYIYFTSSFSCEWTEGDQDFFNCLMT